MKSRSIRLRIELNLVIDEVDAKVSHRLLERIINYESNSIKYNKLLDKIKLSSDNIYVVEVFLESIKHNHMIKDGKVTLSNLAEVLIGWC
jgi:hypothetical protein